MPAPRALLFDLGNTLVAYYRKEEFAPVLQRAVESSRSVLQQHGVTLGSVDEAMQRALAENREAPDYRFSPLLPRLQRIFRLPDPLPSSLENQLTAAFMRPIFHTARIYEDALDALKTLRQQQIKTAVVSNSPWGSAPAMWQQELLRLGLRPLVDAAVFCGDVGWRKPAPAIFHHAANLLGEKPVDCLFVGDDPEWDIQGGSAAGMRTLLIDRAGVHPAFTGDKITALTELPAYLHKNFP